MSTKKTYNIKLQGIDITEKSLVVNQPPEPASGFNFNLTVNTIVDKSKKLVIIHLTITFKSLKGGNVNGKLSMNIKFEIINFEDLPKKENGEYAMSKELDNILRNIAIHTARGIMYSEFKGTMFNSSMLPLIDASAMKPQNSPVKP